MHGAHPEVQSTSAPLDLQEPQPKLYVGLVPISVKLNVADPASAPRLIVMLDNTYRCALDPLRIDNGLASYYGTTNGFLLDDGVHTVVVFDERNVAGAKLMQFEVSNERSFVAELREFF